MDPAPSPDPDALYRRCFPYYAELCALSELRKKPGFGVKLRSGIGGHALLYLNGVRRDRAAGYPVLRLGDPDDPATTAGGVAISVNEHYRNANWIATDGPDFCLRGDLAPGEPVSEAAYRRTQDRARALGLLDGIVFHDRFLRDKPPGVSAVDHMYELSIGTDYAACFGRDIYRARLPLDRARMGAVVDYLNALNAPYRAGARDFHWRVLNDNCAHVTHNALAAAGVWPVWPTGQFFAVAAFRFPVPKNELVDLARRANELPIDDPAALYRDDAARRALLDTGTLPCGPGGLVIASPAIAENAIYDVAGLRLIFYDNPFWGPYRRWFDAMFRTPRYLDLGANLRHFAALYARAPRGGDTEFARRYSDHIAAQAERTAAWLQPH